MKQLFIYNEENGELFCSQDYNGGEIPKNGTLEVPPKTKENETVVFKDGAWVIMKDYRFTHRMIDSENNLEFITELGNIPEGWNLITNAEAEVIEEQKRIAGLFMTKYDFYKYVLLPNGVNYETLMSVLSQSMEMKAAWDLCANVYRGDPLLNEHIKDFITITDEQLDEIFETYGTSNEEPNAEAITQLQE